MENINTYLKSAKHTRDLFLKYWLANKGDKGQLIKFLGYPFELQLGVVLEFLHLHNISVHVFTETYDLLILDPSKLSKIDQKLNETKSHFVYEYKGDLVFICYNQKFTGNKSPLHKYMIAVVTAINWLNFK